MGHTPMPAISLSPLPTHPSGESRHLHPSNFHSSNSWRVKDLLQLKCEPSQPGILVDLDEYSRLAGTVSSVIGVVKRRRSQVSGARLKYEYSVVDDVCVF